MAVVWAGWQEELDRPVALKVLAEHLADDAEFRARFMREARIASKLQHPNLVRVFDIAEHDGLPCIVMELVPGQTLEGSRVTLDEAAQIAEGLAHAHARGVIHRDLKPGNLIRRTDGVVKIADFGIARAAEETRLTQIGTVLGTLRYLAPEQAEGRDVGPEADVYSLGVVLEELLDDEPRPVRKALDRARSRDPRARPSAAALAAVLRDHAGDAASRGQTAPTLPAPTIALRRHTALRAGPVVASVLLLVAVAVGLALGSLGGNDAKPRAPALVRPVPHSDDTAQQARNLSSWLTQYSKK
jgi:serine/threonine protein kinase